MLETLLTIAIGANLAVGNLPLAGALLVVLGLNAFRDAFLDRRS